MGKVSGFREPELLSDTHRIFRFESGKPALDAFLLDLAATSQRSGFARTFVVSDDDVQVVGYYALCGGSINRSDAPRQIVGHGAPIEVPVVLLARLAVHRDFQGQGLGTMLMHHAFKSTLASAQTVGFRALMVHALDDEARIFYSKFGFRASRYAERTLLLAVPDIVHILENVPRVGE
jgi:GNAT superfamily N-acetyltransferase